MPLSVRLANSSGSEAVSPWQLIKTPPAKSVASQGSLAHSASAIGLRVIGSALIHSVYRIPATIRIRGQMPRAQAFGLRTPTLSRHLESHLSFATGRGGYDAETGELPSVIVGRNRTVVIGCSLVKRAALRSRRPAASLPAAGEVWGCACGGSGYA